MRKTKLDRLPVHGAVVSYGKNQTPHYLYQNKGEAGPAAANEDYGLFDPRVGLIVGDGIGGSRGGATMSRLAVKATAKYARQAGLSRLRGDEAVRVTRDVILPRVDRVLSWAKFWRFLPKESGTTLGAVLRAREGWVAVGIGDTPVYGYDDTGGGKLTMEQCSGNIIFNSLNGRGRPSAQDAFPDQVQYLPRQPGQRFMIPTDGLLGDHSYQHLPQQYNGRDPIRDRLYSSGNPHRAAEAIAQLPELLLRAGYAVEHEGLVVPFVPKTDDLTVGAMFVGR